MCWGVYLKGVKIVLYRFDGERYITKGINARLPIEIQLMLFGGLDLMRIKTGDQLDYLQIFKLKTVEQDKKFLLRIRHEQEIPEAGLDYFMVIDEPIDEKVYIIDDGGENYYVVGRGVLRNDKKSP